MKKSKLARRFPLLAPGSKLLAFLVFAACGLGAPMVYGQAGEAILDKTTFGHSQNDDRDLANSLVPGPKRYGKGEKKEEVDLKNLPSKTAKDTTFQGNLMDLDLDWHGDKLGKPASNGDKDSKTAKSADAGGAKDSKVSKQADTSGDKDPKKTSKSAQTADGQNKDQKATSAASDEKPSEKEKTSVTKPDGDH